MLGPRAGMSAAVIVAFFAVQMRTGTAKSTSVAEGEQGIPPPPSLFAQNLHKI